jgi:hypothetical protein
LVGLVGYGRRRLCHAETKGACIPLEQHINVRAETFACVMFLSLSLSLAPILNMSLYLSLLPLSR